MNKELGISITENKEARCCAAVAEVYGSVWEPQRLLRRQRWVSFNLFQFNQLVKVVKTFYLLLNILVFSNSLCFVSPRQDEEG